MIHIKTSNILKDYTFDRCLGFGSFGEVRLGIHNKSNNYFAIKKQAISQDDKDQLESIYNEINMLI